MNALDAEAEDEIAQIADGEEFRKMLRHREAATCDCRECRNLRRRLVRWGYSRGRSKVVQALAADANGAESDAERCLGEIEKTNAGYYAKRLRHMLGRFRHSG